MICASCNEVLSEPGERCPACQGEVLLRGRYRLEEIVGRGASGITFRATRLSDGHIVAIKEMPFHRLGSLKAHELFERETRILRQLSHPGIPVYFDDFSSGVGKHLSFYLVQEHIDGQNLAQEMAQRRYREDQVLEILAEILGLLTYLHSLSPPIIHRDLKPSNVMRRRRGGLVLIDFGAVRDVLKDPVLGGSTVAGTFGFMAPEQFQGLATPATDIYGLGVLAVVLLSRRQPDTLVDEHNQLQWEPHIQVGPATRALLRQMLAPSPRARASSAAALRAEIEATLRAHRHEAAAQPRRMAAAAPARADGDAVPPGQGRKLALGLAGAALLTGLVALLASIPSTTGSGAATCETGPCQPVPRGLAGLRFGMSWEEARAALPELAEVVELEPEYVHPLLSIPDPFEARASAAVPGQRVSVATTLGKLPATCELGFAVDSRLSKMVCRIQDLETRASHIATESELLASLKRRYGLPLSGGIGPAAMHLLGHKRTGDWTWRDEGASLVLKSRLQEQEHFGVPQREEDHPSFAGRTEVRSELVLENTSQEHQSLVHGLMDALEQRQSAKEAQERRQLQERIDRAREQLEAAGEELEADL